MVCPTPPIDNKSNTIPPSYNNNAKGEEEEEDGAEKCGSRMRRRSPRLIGAFCARRYGIPGQIYDNTTTNTGCSPPSSSSSSSSLRVTLNPPQLKNQCVRLALYTVAESYIRNVILPTRPPLQQHERDPNGIQTCCCCCCCSPRTSVLLEEEDFILPAWPKKNDKIKGSCFGEALAEGAYYRVCYYECDASEHLATTIDTRRQGGGGACCHNNNTLIILPLKAWPYGSYPAIGLSLLIRRVLIQTTCGVAVGVRKHINDRRRGAYYGIKEYNNNKQQQQQWAAMSTPTEHRRRHEPMNQMLRLKVQGSHAFVIVGFELDDNSPGGGIFIFMDNSGPEWGHAGYGICSFDFVDSYVDDIAQATVAPLPTSSSSSSAMSSNESCYPVYQHLADNDKYHVKCCGCHLCINDAIPQCNCFACCSIPITTTITTTTTTTN